MAFVRVTVIDPDGNAHAAEVNQRASLDSIARDLAEDLELSPVDDYTIRHAGKIHEGSILVIDKGMSRSARLLD